MATNQPEWQCIANLGDVSPVDYGGFFVFIDRTGVYAPEAEYLDAPEDDTGTWHAYRFILERCLQQIDGVLSDNEYHPEAPAWFADKLESVAESAGMDERELRTDLCAKDPIRRAGAYQTLLGYFGPDEFDSDPLTLTRDEADARYSGPRYQLTR